MLLSQLLTIANIVLVRDGSGTGSRVVLVASLGLVGSSGTSRLEIRGLTAVIRPGCIATGVFPFVQRLRVVIVEETNIGSTHCEKQDDSQQVNSPRTGNTIVE